LKLRGRKDKGERTLVAAGGDTARVWAPSTPFQGAGWMSFILTGDFSGAKLGVAGAIRTMVRAGVQSPGETSRTGLKSGGWAEGERVSLFQGLPEGKGKGRKRPAFKGLVGGQVFRKDRRGA